MRIARSPFSFRVIVIFFRNDAKSNDSVPRPQRRPQRCNRQNGGSERLRPFAYLEEASAAKHEGARIGRCSGSCSRNSRYKDFIAPPLARLARRTSITDALGKIPGTLMNVASGTATVQIGLEGSGSTPFGGLVHTRGSEAPFIYRASHLPIFPPVFSRPGINLPSVYAAAKFQHGLFVPVNCCPSRKQDKDK